MYLYYVSTFVTLLLPVKILLICGEICLHVDAGEDEDCERHSPCKHRGFLVNGTCYMLGLPKAEASLNDLQRTCVEFSGNLASLNTQQEMTSVVMGLVMKKHKVRGLAIGLRTAGVGLPSM